jgi:3'(2'), 5'-bisphosphate nucleotidase
MSDMNLEYLCLNAKDIAREAGDVILSVYNDAFDISHKADNTPVTTADILAHNLIVKGLRELTPDIPILSEESKKIPFAERQQWETYWLVDPLDGTREFIKHNGEFSVNIALINNHDSILGVIYAPVLEQDYYAWKDGGAWKQETRASAQPIHVRNEPEQKLVVAGSRSHGSERYHAYLDTLGDIEVISMGSSLKSCLVAEGTADLYPRLGPTSEWDTAAAQCIVEEAEGFVLDAQGQPLRYNTKDSLMNPDFFVSGNSEIPGVIQASS